MYRLIASDLDETLLTKDKTVSAKNREWIEKARAKGVHFVPATGRGFASIQNTLDELHLLDQSDSYTISYNGGVLTENKNNRLIATHPMPFEEVDALFQIGLKKNVAIHIYTMEHVYVYRINPNEAAYLAPTMAYTLLAKPSISFLKEQPLAKILFQNLDREYLQSIQKELPEKLLEATDISYSSNRYLEFNPRGVNKGAALKQLADYLNIPIEETIAVGDNLNDQTMIEAAGLGIAVSNAAPEIKAVADTVTQASFEQDALAEIIQKYIF